MLKGEDSKLAFFMMIRNLVHLLLVALEMIFFGRAILSWFRETENETVIKIYEVLYNLSEPLILPMRMLLDKFAWSKESPIDFSFFFTFMIIVILTMFF